jgi:hypothetical protein
LIGLKPALLLQHKMLADVRCGSKVRMAASNFNVRYAPESRHPMDGLERPLCAKTGREQVQ